MADGNEQGIQTMDRPEQQQTQERPKIIAQKPPITDREALLALAKRQKEQRRLPASHKGEQDKSLSMSWTHGENNKSRRTLGVSKSKKVT